MEAVPGPFPAPGALLLETIRWSAREPIAVAAIAAIERTSNSGRFQRLEHAFLGIGVAPFPEIVSTE